MLTSRLRYIDPRAHASATIFLGLYHREGKRTFFKKCTNSFIDEGAARYDKRLKFEFGDVRRVMIETSQQVSSSLLTFSAYIIERENERFFKSGPTALSPRAATYDNRLKFKFVDFEEL